MGEAMHTDLGRFLEDLDDTRRSIALALLRRAAIAVAVRLGAEIAGDFDSGLWVAYRPGEEARLSALSAFGADVHDDHQRLALLEGMAEDEDDTRPHIVAP